MALYFKDRIPDQVHGENARYYDAVGNNGAAKLSDFKLVMKNNIPADRTGTPLSAGNLNFASGNVALPAALPAETRRGNVISLIGDKAVTAKTKRAIAVTGPDFATAQLSNGFIRLSDTKLLLIFNNRLAVATVNFNNKTVSFGEYFVPGNGYILNSASLLRSFDENPVALVSGMFKATYSPYPYRPTVFRIDSAGKISSLQGSDLSSPNLYNSVTNMVRVGNSAALMCMKTASNVFHITLFTINSEGTPYLTQTTQVAVSGFDTSTYLNNTLFCYDKGNNKYVLIYVNPTTTNVYALPITVSGTNITAGSAQLLGTTSDTLYSASYMPGGTDRFYTGDGKIILSDAESYLSPGKIQVLSVNSSGIVSKGPVYGLPIAGMNTTTSYLTRKDNKLYLTGVECELSPYEGCLLEMTMSGTNLEYSKFKPFTALKITNGNNAIYLKNLAYENPNNAGEFLFMQGYNAAPMTDLTFWFGNKFDCPEPSNIIGIALEDPADGYVRVQAAGKHLPGIFSGLKPGQFYAAGEKGSLTPVSGAAGTNPIGIATSPTDFLFFGAKGL